MATSPASGPGGSFNGGIITTPLEIDGDGSAPALDIHADPGNDTVIRAYDPNTGDGLVVEPTGNVRIVVGPNTAGLLVTATDATFPVFALRSFAWSAPDDVHLSSNQVALWLDPTPGATKLMVKAKDSGGTVRSAAIALS